MRTGPGTEILAIRLWREVVIRNSLSAIPHVLLVFICMAFCLGMHQQNPLTLLSHFFVITGCVLRFVIFRYLPQDHLPSPAQRLVYSLSLFFIGLGWSVFLENTHHFYGYYSFQGLLSLLLLVGFISAALPSNAAQPLGYLCLLMPVMIYPVVSLIMDPSPEHWMLVGLVYFYGFFHVFQLRVSYSYIRQFLSHDTAMTLERDKLQNLVNAVPGYVSFIDKNLRYLSVNEFGKAFFNLKDYEGKHICHGFEDSEFSTFIQKFMSEERQTAISEIKFQMQPGYSTFIISIKKLIEPLGGAVIVAIPMDELIETREKMKAQEAKALYTAKLVSLGEMAAGIAHEINNPLAIILGSSDQLMRQLKKPDMQIERVELLTAKIQQMVGRISLIIKSLRVLSRNGEKDPHSPFKLESILEPSIEISRQRFKEENIELEIQKENNEEIVCVGQEIQLSQVMMNLLSNAFDAAMEGPPPRWVRLQVRSGVEHVDICIQDSGLGIPPEIRNKIMEPFFTTKAINKGTGLGLSISKSIMEQHGGLLTLDENAPNTTFIMRMKKKTE